MAYRYGDDHDDDDDDDDHDDDTVCLPKLLLCCISRQNLFHGTCGSMLLTHVSFWFSYSL